MAAVKYREWRRSSSISLCYVAVAWSWRFTTDYASVSLVDGITWLYSSFQVDRGTFRSLLPIRTV